MLPMNFFCICDDKFNTTTANAQVRPRIAMDASGRAVVVWESSGQDTSGTGVFARLFGSTGLPAGPEFQANALSLAEVTNVFGVGGFVNSSEPGKEVKTSTGDYLQYNEDRLGPRLREYREAGNDSFVVEVEG